MKKTNSLFSIKGMHCAVCAGNVENTIKKLTGVITASVNLAAESAAVTYDCEVVSPEDIIASVNALGFSASLPEDKSETESEKKDELKKERTTLVISLIFSAILFIIAMFPMLGIFYLPAFLTEPKVLTVVELLLVIPVIICGFHFYTSGFKSLFRGVPNMDTLVATGTLAALVYSIYSTVSVYLGNAHAVHGLYFESAAMIIALVKLGKFLEKRATKKTSEAVGKLVSLTPQTATVLRDDDEVTIPVQDVKINDIIVVRPGEKIPVDGVIIYGSSDIDESMITGESMPVTKTENDEVIGGCINGSGFIKVRATRIGEDSTLAQVIRTVSEAQASKAPIARLADKVSGHFVVTVIIIAFISSVCWALSGKDFVFALSVFISVLVISCPCALGLATPVAIMAGTGVSAENGILFRNGAALEHASKTSVVVFDKTGTITTGNPAVSDIVSDIDKNELLSLSASVESASEHLLGQTIVSYAKANSLEIPVAEDFEYSVGAGVSAIVRDKRIFVGNKGFIKNLGSFESIGTKLSESGKTCVYVADEEKVLGVIAISDTVKDSAKEGIEKLKADGIEIYMLTGDNAKTATAIAKEVGIEKVISEVKPNEKSDVISKLKSEGKVVCMVGDGINDAPALASADVSITVASGTDIAAEASDIVLMKNNLSDIHKTIKISKAVTRNIKQNLFWAFIYNIIGIPVAAGVLYLFGGPLLNPMLAAAAMSLSSVTVVTNALRLTRKKF